LLELELEAPDDALLRLRPVAQRRCDARLTTLARNGCGTAVPQITTVARSTGTTDSGARAGESHNALAFRERPKMNQDEDAMAIGDETDCEGAPPNGYRYEYLRPVTYPRYRGAAKLVSRMRRNASCHLREAFMKTSVHERAVRTRLLVVVFKKD